MKIPTFYKSLKINTFQLRFLIKMISIFLACWTSLSLLLLLKIPESFTKLYAEDGAISLESALKNSFPSNLFTPIAGYLDIVAHLAGSFAVLFPLVYAPSLFFAFNTFVYTLICFTVFYASKEFIPNPINRFFLSLSLILLPIAGFESIANTTNLHFFLVSACIPILIKTSFTMFQSIYFSFFVFFASLSVPLLVFLFPLLAFRRITVNHKSLFTKPNLVEVMWTLGLLLQFLFIASNGFLAATKSEGFNSILKPIYLYLDRVLGTTLIPTWGFVSKGDITANQDLSPLNSPLYIRAILSLITFILLIFYVISRNKQKSEARKVAILVIVTTSFYWICVGVVFNSAPRYAILPAFGLIFALFCVQDVEPVTNKLHIKSIALPTLIILTWIGSWQPSQFRVEGPVWIDEFRKAEFECSTGKEDVDIRIIPLNQNWTVTVDCRKIQRLD